MEGRGERERRWMPKRKSRKASGWDSIIVEMLRYDSVTLIKWFLRVSFKNIREGENLQLLRKSVELIY